MGGAWRPPNVSGGTVRVALDPNNIGFDDEPSGAKESFSVSFVSNFAPSTMSFSATEGRGCFKVESSISSPPPPSPPFDPTSFLFFSPSSGFANRRLRASALAISSALTNSSASATAVEDSLCLLSSNVSEPSMSDGSPNCFSAICF